MFEPTTLPTATSGLPPVTDPIVTASSGKLVPKATTVRPTTTGLMPDRDREARRASDDEFAADGEQDQADDDREQAHGSITRLASTRPSPSAIPAS